MKSALNKARLGAAEHLEGETWPSAPPGAQTKAGGGDFGTSLLGFWRTPEMQLRNHPPANKRQRHSSIKK